MHIQSSDISSIDSILQDDVKQTDMLIILGDFTGLSQSEGIHIFCMLLMNSIYKKERLALPLGFLGRFECPVRVINFLQIVPLLSAYCNVELRLQRFTCITEGWLFGTSVLCQPFQTIQSFCRRTQYKKLALKNSFNLERHKKDIFTYSEFGRNLPISGCCSSSPDLWNVHANRKY